MFETGFTVDRRIVNGLVTWIQHTTVLTRPVRFPREKKHNDSFRQPADVLPCLAFTTPNTGSEDGLTLFYQHFSTGSERSPTLII